MWPQWCPEEAPVQSRSTPPREQSSSIFIPPMSIHAIPCYKEHFSMTHVMSMYEYYIIYIYIYNTCTFYILYSIFYIFETFWNISTYIIYTHYIYIYIMSSHVYHSTSVLGAPGRTSKEAHHWDKMAVGPLAPNQGEEWARGVLRLVLLIIVYHFVSLVVICSVSMQFITNIGSTIYAAGSQVAVCPSFMNVTGCNCIDQKIVSVHSVKLYLSFLDQGRLIKHRRAPYK